MSPPRPTLSAGPLLSLSPRWSSVPIAAVSCQTLLSESPPASLRRSHRLDECCRPLFAGERKQRENSISFMLGRCLTLCLCVSIFLTQKQHLCLIRSLSLSHFFSHRLCIFCLSHRCLTFVVSIFPSPTFAKAVSHHISLFFSRVMTRSFVPRHSSSDQVLSSSITRSNH